MSAIRSSEMTLVTGLLDSGAAGDEGRSDGRFAV